MPELPHTRRSSHHDVPEMLMDHFFINRMSDSERTVINFLHCETGCTCACAVDKGPGDFPVRVICQGLEFCGKKEINLKTDKEHAYPLAVCQ